MRSRWPGDGESDAPRRTSGVEAHLCAVGVGNGLVSEWSCRGGEAGELGLGETMRGLGGHVKILIWDFYPKTSGKPFMGCKP